MRNRRSHRRGDADERIAVIADDAEQRSVEQILALEEELERVSADSAAKIDELQRRLSEAEARATAAENAAQESRAQVAALKRVRAEAREAVGPRVERPEARATAAKWAQDGSGAAASSASTRNESASARTVSLSNASFEDLRGLGLS